MAPRINSYRPCVKYYTATIKIPDLKSGQKPHIMDFRLSRFQVQR
ncbi:hypothetical protein L798_02610 [Zootermopsis nevadensis]|uniref:Uncharacterized protein n=1 Tax=Zootermopsis nevadensis TaxID=136037 RepID=A0A067RFJ3_ZOONE|nr:hypothetical protein L798_02610 [Zootermopsis nevadensis]